MKKNLDLCVAKAFGKTQKYTVGFLVFRDKLIHIYIICLPQTQKKNAKIQKYKKYKHKKYRE